VRRHAELFGLIVLVVAWEGLPRLFPTPWFPALSDVVAALRELYDDGLLMDAIKGSFSALLVGFLISLTLGLVIGLAMGRFALVRSVLDTYVSAALFAPSLILAPIFFTFFGLGSGTRVCVIVSYTMPIIILNTSTGIRTVSTELPEMARSFGAGELQTLRSVLVPASLPLLLEGVRIGVGRSIKGMINGETFIALVGLGGLASRYGDRLDSPKVFAVTLVVLVLALALNWLFTRFETRCLKWL
jgi:NitT/TauT family transport system permease protein